jgi:hypothetical protein
LNDTFQTQINSSRFPDILGKNFPATLKTFYVRSSLSKFIQQIKVKVKVKQTGYRPGVAQRVPGS